MRVEDALSRVDVEILTALANCRMNISATARKSRYDRKTVEYHLGRVHSATGLDPKNFWDLHKLLNMLGVGGE